MSCDTHPFNPPHSPSPPAPQPQPHPQRASMCNSYTPRYLHAFSNFLKAHKLVIFLIPNFYFLHICSLQKEKNLLEYSIEKMSIMYALYNMLSYLCSSVMFTVISIIFLGFSTTSKLKIISACRYNRQVTCLQV